MKQVSPEYQKTIQLHRTQGFRNTMHAKINFGLIDQYAMSDATFTISPGVSFSDTSGITSGVNNVTGGYASWEQDFWQLNGKQRFFNPQNPLKAGYISSAISNEYGNFHVDEKPYIDISFSTLHSMVGLTIQFDTFTGTAPKAFSITTYENGALKKTYYTTDNTDVIYQGELGIEDVDRIRIEFNVTNPFNRIRIDSMLFGIAYSFSDDDLISITHNRSTSPISLELPSESLIFTLFNEDGKYDIDSSFNIIPFLQKEQVVTIQYGYDVDGEGNVEWLEQSKYWLTSWETDGINATFTCKDIFNRLLNTTYYKGVFDHYSHNARNLAVAVLEDAGVEDYWVDDYGLQKTFSYLPLIYASHAENLQLLGNLGLSSLEQNANGGIIFRYREQVPQSNMVVYSCGNLQTPYSYYYSTVQRPGGVFDEISAADYATYEEDFFALDGTMSLLPRDGETFYENAGFVSNVFPGENGEYPGTDSEQAPFVELDFTRNITFGSLELFTGHTSGTDTFYLKGMRDTTPSSSTTNLEMVYSKTLSGEWKNGRLIFNENFDRIVRLYIYCVKNPKKQRGRILQVKVNYPMCFALQPDDVIGNPKGELLDRCSSVTLNATGVKYWTNNPTEPKQTISVLPNTLTEIKHSDAYYACRFECDNPSVVISREEHYAFVSYIEITGVTEAVDVELYANTYASETTIPYSKTINAIGEPVVVDNPIYSESAAAGPVAVEWMADYLSKRNQYTIETLGYPEVDPGDLILYDGKEATVIEANIHFEQGAMRENFVLRGEKKIGGMADTKNGLGN